jgi:HSP20 family protein
MKLTKWNPTKEMLKIEKEFNKMFESLQKRFGFLNAKNDIEEYEKAEWSPLTDIIEHKDKYELKIELPGLTKDDVKITYCDGQLAICGERKQEKEEKKARYHMIERAYGKYYRSFSLPSNVKHDKIEANFKDGVLTINIPKADEAKPKEIEIK